MMKLDDLEALAKAATPGPWDYDGGYILNGVCCDSPRLAKCFSDVETNFPWLDNAEYIAAANPATILEMVNLIRMMKEELKLANQLIYGKPNHMGLWDCIDGYYASAFNDEMEQFSKCNALAAVERWEKGESE